MSEPLVKQIVDLKEEHSLMLETLRLIKEWLISPIHTRVNITDVERAMDIAIKAAEEGNKRRVEQGNVEMP